MAGQKNEKHKDIVWGKRSNKKWLIIGIVAAVVIAGALGFVLFALDWDSDITTTLTNKTGDKTARRTIDGVKASPDNANLYPVAIMIENLVTSRPPSGLSKAQVVYEALAEGGITRFMAIYAGERNNIPEIGPVRSARPYFVDWALEYGALYFHAGGSPQSLQDIQTYDVFDLNQFYNSQYFWRDSERNAPHNLYTSGELAAYALRDKEAPEEGIYQGWKFQDDAPLAKRPTEEKSISIDYSSFNYRVEYKYNRQENEYIRYQAGEEHSDKDGTVITAKNVIVQKVKTTLADESRLAMSTVGTGEAMIFRDGSVINGTWEKEATGERTFFYDADGREVTLTAGTIWVEVVPTDRTIEYL